ncbi:LysR family transcriptional regulator [Donghicola sp. XS_ASV15]|uniref:LysR family transcriptional regulator n=1 Tax=Donghicola sp. XS_ASV15 TaxID=3241295 RepID=UPI0035149D4C
MDWLRMPSLPALRAFAALAQSGSVSRAGALLNVTHAAISQQIRQLEGHLGTPLVARQGRGVMLTPEGTQLAQVLLPALETIYQKVEEMTDGDETRPLQVAAAPLFTINWLMPRLDSFRQQHPEIEVLLNPTAEIVDLRPAGIDMAVRYGAGVWPALEATLLLPSDLVLVGSPSLVGDREFTGPADALDLKWLMETGSNETGVWLDVHGITAAKGPDVTQLPNAQLIDGLLDGEGIALVSRAMVRRPLKDGSLKVLFESPNEALGYYFVTRPGVQRKSLSTFAEWLKGQLSQ